MSLPLTRRLWEHPDPTSTEAWRFMQSISKKHCQRRPIQSWDQLQQWSTNNISTFWEEMFIQHPVIHDGQYAKVYDETARMDSVPRWFEGVNVNFAENLLFSPDPKDPNQATTKGKEDHKIACTEVREGCKEIRHVTWRELRERVALLANAMRAHGVTRGDRVAIVASNSLDTLCVFYATTSLGGLFSSSSTDMGTKGVLDRLTQIRPKYIFVDDWAVYNGKTVDLRPKMREFVEGMGSVPEFKTLVSMSRWRKSPSAVTTVPRTLLLSSFLEAAKGDRKLAFTRIPFSDPFIIVYSSGTTGMPKCIVHSAGGVLLNSCKESRVHRDVGPGNTVLQYTTTGWIMYLSSVLVMQHGARVILYDGSPFQPGLETFVRLVGEQKVTDLGLSPRYLRTLASAKPPVLPREVADLSHLKRVGSTGMVLPDALYEWFYDHGFPPSVQLANLSGGTDLAACLTGDTPLKPLYVGGCQTAMLGFDVRVYDQTIEGGRGIKGKEVPIGEAGELVCAKPFPTMPVRFWGSDGAEKYFKAYFERFDDVWTHGDFIQVHPATRQIIFSGRADGVLNPSGVRFGSAEIYNVIDQHFPDEILDSICVGQRRQQDDDEAVMLFLLMKPGNKFSQSLVKKVKEAIAKEVGRRCVPTYVFETPEIPTTVNLKKVELPVKQIVSGKTIKPSDTLLNKECLDFYYQFAKVEDLVPAQSKL
ncbi:acetoacetate-CoA ligase [Polychaeton citri CBS 116435]|uniref:Acetoacetate-CoA ligase n=1 Tax=Polychaeton citri CBS 116435 TaxID=1314669 RepID=A0A9P4Q6K6_9PEZI|nr:acetoacetate-CoA ligase [Polychaeton citri CBS 116435]